MKTLKHPYIVGYKDTIQSKTGDKLYLAMEFCEKGDMAEWIAGRSRAMEYMMTSTLNPNSETSSDPIAKQEYEQTVQALANQPPPLGLSQLPSTFSTAEEIEKYFLFSEDAVLELFAQLALALHHIHRNKALHRDLKTQNVFVTVAHPPSSSSSSNSPTPESSSSSSSSYPSQSPFTITAPRVVVKIGDFGISKVVQSETSLAQTVIGTPVGFLYILHSQPCSSLL